jgi:hypothetical protein
MNNEEDDINFDDCPSFDNTDEAAANTSELDELLFRGNTPREIHELIDDAIGTSSADITSWEDGFLTSTEKLSSLSKKQRACLVRIYAKLLNKESFLYNALGIPEHADNRGVLDKIMENL